LVLKVTLLIQQAGNWMSFSTNSFQNILKDLTWLFAELRRKFVIFWVHWLDFGLTLEDISNSKFKKTYQSVILLGQTINTTLYQRRLYILSSICKDSVKAKLQLKEKANLFKGHKALFGSTYRKKIMALSTEREKSGTILKSTGLESSTSKPFSRDSHTGGTSRSSGGNGNKGRTVTVKRQSFQEGRQSNEGRFIIKIVNSKFHITRGRFSKAKVNPVVKALFPGGFPVWAS